MGRPPEDQAVQKMLERTNHDFWRRGRTQLLLALAATCAVHAFASAAHAQDAQQTAAAEALFDEARKLMTEGQLQAACPKLEESERLAPAVGTLLNLGICYEKSHRPASAWATFKEAVSAARASGQSDREALAQTHAVALESKLSTLTIRVPSAMENVSGVEVRRDGLVLARASWGSAIPLDPGAHRIDVTAPSRKAWSTTVTFTEQVAATDVDVPTLAVVAAPKSFKSVAVRTPIVAEESSSSTQRTLSFVVMGAGLAGLATGGVFGVIAKSKNDDALANHCGGGNVCDARGLALTDDARSAGTIATISFAAGGAALVTGAVLFFTAPKHSSSPSARAALHAAPTLSAHSAGLCFGGTW
ncbi:MAG: hypothetical protein ABI461_01810 [Polyangiaceae bacterium]